MDQSTAKGMRVASAFQALASKIRLRKVIGSFEISGSSAWQERIANVHCFDNSRLSSAFGNSHLNSRITAHSPGPEITAQSPSAVRAIRTAFVAVLVIAYQMGTPSPPSRYTDGVIPMLFFVLSYSPRLDP